MPGPPWECGAEEGENKPAAIARIAPARCGHAGENNSRKGRAPWSGSSDRGVETRQPQAARDPANTIAADPAPPLFSFMHCQSTGIRPGCERRIDEVRRGLSEFGRQLSTGPLIMRSAPPSTPSSTAGDTMASDRKVHPVPLGLDA